MRCAKTRVEIDRGSYAPSARKPEAQLDRLARREFACDRRRRFGAAGRRVHRCALALDHKTMERVLDVGARIPLPNQPLEVGFVLGEEQSRRRRESFENELPERGVLALKAIAGPCVRFAASRS